jgi:hypothetical protein
VCFRIVSVEFWCTSSHTSVPGTFWNSGCFASELCDFFLLKAGGKGRIEHGTLTDELSLEDFSIVEFGTWSTVSSPKRLGFRGCLNGSIWG